MNGIEYSIMNFERNELFLLFYMYAFISWCLESLYCYLKEKKFVNVGLLFEPLSIKYGFIIFIIAINSFNQNELLIYKIVKSIVIILIVFSLQDFFVEKITGITPIYKSFKDKILNSSILSLVIISFIEIIQPLILILFSFVPPIVIKWVSRLLILILIVDLVFTTILFVFIKDRNLIYEEKHIYELKGNLSQSIVLFFVKRLKKAYKISDSNNLEILDEKTLSEKGLIFGKDISFYKLLWIFLVMSFIGDIIETIYVLLVNHILMRRSSLAHLPLSLVWGVGAVIFTIVLYKYRNSKNLLVFSMGALIGGVYEYMCSVVTEIIFGVRFWDYSDMPFNIHGRTNLLFMIFWGAISLIWIKYAYPKLSAIIEKFPLIIGYIITSILIIVVSADIVLTIGILGRYAERRSNYENNSYTAKYFDINWPDEKIKNVWPNLDDI